MPLGRSNTRTVLPRLYVPLLNSVLNSTSQDSYRTSATDSLSVWFQRVNQLCLAQPSSASQFNVSLQDATQIFNFVLDFWTDSGAALGNALKELFIKLISALRLLHADELEDLLRQWTQVILKLPRRMRALYFMVEILSKQVGGTYILDTDPTLTSEALNLMNSNALANPIGKALYAVYSSIWRKETEDSIAADYAAEWTQLWSSQTLDVLLNNLPAGKHIQMYFLPQMFRLCPLSFSIFIKPLLTTSLEGPENNLFALLGLLKTGQNQTNIDPFSLIGEEFLGQLFNHESPSLRISGLSLAVASPKGSKPVVPYVFDLIKQSMDSLFADTDPEFRNQIHGLLRQFIFRIRGSAYAMSREVRNLRGKPNSLVEKIEVLERDVEQIRSFCSWFLNYLNEQLRPGCPYQDLYTGISLFTLMVQSGLDDRVDSKYHEKQHIPFPFSIPVYTSVSVKLLLNNIMNNYEDIRQGAMNVLKMAPLPVTHLESIEDVDKLSSKSLELISGMRGREGDAGARLSELVFFLYQRLSGSKSSTDYFIRLLDKLESEMRYAQTDLAAAVREHSIHGYFTALRFILESGDVTVSGPAWSGLISRLFSSIQAAWGSVKDILCHDSPEGNLPDSFEDGYDPTLELKYGPATQVILSYSWRAVKESTGLLKILLDSLPISDKTLLPDHLVISAGEMILSQLATVRHRGAFSSVYPTFVSCCRRCNKSPGLDTQSNEWLRNNLQLIQTKAQYITRRSGGLPYLITAVLSADLDPKKALFSETFKILLDIANSPVITSEEEKLDLPQVHAFNCIKALFVETELAPYCTGYVDKALDLSIRSFSNQIWAIRNCAVMLFTALQNRLFGTIKYYEDRKRVSTISARLFFTQHKQVRPILLENLLEYLSSNHSVSNLQTESVVPVLSIISRLEITEQSSGYQGELDDFVPLIIRCLDSHIWKVREMAAMSLPRLVQKDFLMDFCHNLLIDASPTNQNQLHGRCLAIFNIISLDSPTPQQSDNFTRLLQVKFNQIIEENKSSITRLAFLRILRAYSMYFSEEFVITIRRACLRIYEEKCESLSATHRLLRKWALEFLMDSDHQLISKALEDNAYEVQLTAIETVDQHDLNISSDIKQSLWKLFRNQDVWDQVRAPALKSYIEKGPEISQLRDNWNILYTGISELSSEQIRETCIEALGPATAVQTSEENQFSRWLDILNVYSNDNRIASTRLACFKSLSGFLKHTPGISPSPQPYLVLFKFLHDDDEDIRNEASNSVSILLNLRFNATAYFCSKQLLTFLCQHYKVSIIPFLLEELKGSTMLQHQLDNALAEDNLLFTVEKQNVFVNELKKLEMIKVALEGMRPQDVQPFTSWLSPGLQYLQKSAHIDELGLSPELYLVRTRIELSLDLYRIWTSANL